VHLVLAGNLAAQSAVSAFVAAKAAAPAAPPANAASVPEKKEERQRSLVPHNVHGRRLGEVGRELWELLKK
jgi:hypothetical protein